MTMNYLINNYQMQIQIISTNIVVKPSQNHTMLLLKQSPKVRA